MIGFALVSLLVLAQARAGHADEAYDRPEAWLSRGYLPTRPLRSHPSRGRETPGWPAHSLSWPVEFVDASRAMGNSMAEFQSYGDGPYYHGGCDLRVARGSPVRSPIGGRIEAGHYGYSNRPDGSSQKFWSPWPSSGSALYFEVAVVTDDGYRFEFHHMNEKELAPEVLRILKEGQDGRVEAGALLGNTVSWPGGLGAYHHTHYNILTPSGVELNPEHYSPLIEDHEGPRVSAVLAAYKGNRTQLFGDGRFGEAPEFFAVATIDRTDQGAYDHPPAYAGIEFAGRGPSFAWDFRERLWASGLPAGGDGRFPPIWEFFVESIRGPDGSRYATEGGYGKGLSVIRVPVPGGAVGDFTLRLTDQAGNATELKGVVLAAP